MKYVKLFENWLNEAEGEVKPFDAKVPGTTLVVDITQEDLLKDSKETHKILQSMFNRGMAKKDAPDVEESIKVIPLYVGDSKAPNKDPFLSQASSGGSLVMKSIIVNDSEGNKYNVKVETGGSQLEDDLKALQKNKTPIFLVTSSCNFCRRANWSSKPTKNLSMSLVPHSVGIKLFVMGSPYLTTIAVKKSLVDFATVFANDACASI